MITIKEINDLIYHLNLNLNLSDTYTSIFSFESNGDVMFILFNDELLWRSDESHEITSIKKLENSLKLEFNKYVDTIKLSRFETIDREAKLDDGAFEAADKIILNLKNRSLGFDTLDEDIQQEIFDEMIYAIRKHV